MGPIHQTFLQLLYLRKCIPDDPAMICSGNNISASFNAAEVIIYALDDIDLGQKS